MSDEQNLEQQLEAYSEFFKNLVQVGQDHSKHFIIFLFNYLSLGKDDKAAEMLGYITEDYLKNTFVDDMQYAVDCRNKAKRKFDSGLDGTKEQQEAEFFLCGLGVLDYLRENDAPGYDEMMNELSQKSFSISMGNTGLQAVDDEEETE